MRAIGISFGVLKKGSMDKLGRRACFHAVNLYDSMIGRAKLPLIVRGTSKVNMWGYGDRAWVGLLSVQTQWAECPPSAL